MYTGTITREEFGIDLFDMIRMVSGLMAIREHMNVAIHQEKPHKLPDLQKRYDALHVQISAALPKLSPSNLDAVMARYPIVVTL